MVEVCEGAPVAVSGWVLTGRHDLAPCAANSLHRVTMSVNDTIGGTGTLGTASVGLKKINEMVRHLASQLDFRTPSLQETQP